MSSCVIPFCEFDDDTGSGNGDAKLVPICSTGEHVIHVGCLRVLLTKDKKARCPMCRDDYISQLKDMILDNPPETTEVPVLYEAPLVIPGGYAIRNPPSPKRHVNRRPPSNDNSG